MSKKKKEKDPEGHVPHWPAWLEDKFIERTFALWDLEKEQLVTEEDPPRVFPITSWEEYQAVTLQENLAVFTVKLIDFAYLPDMMKPDRVFCTKKGEPTSAKFVGPRNTTRWLYSVKAWDEEEVSLDFLRRLRALCKLMECGTQGSPGSQGQAFWRKIWKEKGYHRHYAPSQSCIHFIRTKANNGGRAETPGMRDEPYEEMVAVDRVRGYPAEFDELPTGSAERIYARGRDMHSPNFDGVAEWVCNVIITIQERLPWAVFAVVDELGRVTRPVEPGVYSTTLWKCEAERAERAGCIVQCYDGYGWHRTTNQHKSVVAAYERLLRECPEEVKPLFKRSFLAGMGIFGMGNEHYSLVSREYKGPDDAPLCLEDGLMLDAFLHKKVDMKQPQMIHWFSCIVARVRCALYDITMELIEAGVTVLRTNFDEVGGLPHPKWSSFPEKADGLPTGSWGRTEWEGTEMTRNRYFKGTRKRDGKLVIKYPGTARDSPERAS